MYAVAHNVPRIPAAAGLYGASYMPFAAHANSATLAALQKNAAVAAAAYGGYAGYMPQTFPAATFQVPIHDVYQTYWATFYPKHSEISIDWSENKGLILNLLTKKKLPKNITQI